MFMHWLKCVRLNRKDRLKNLLGATPEVALLADVSESHSACDFECLTACDWAPLV